ncbi:flavodoxin domain-containing protein [Streptomyces sp. NPDC048172]|uniref:flavodoxin domain-containing protein n=1 Tax=Streptomyces sp. NPDC048172 TaxID=3365505 RepID=UPI00371A48E3
MSVHVLVAYGSRNNSTAEIAEWIAEALRSTGCEAVAKPAASVRAPGEYDAVVLGGALYAGRWHRDATRFAHRHARALRDKPVWLFSSGPLDSSAAERDIPATRQVRHAAHRLNARAHATFGGRLADGAQGWLARRILASGKGGDFRDRDHITAWATAVGRELTGATVTK